jgi:hypothetical protein
VAFFSLHSAGSIQTLVEGATLGGFRVGLAVADCSEPVGGGVVWPRRCQQRSALL